MDYLVRQFTITEGGPVRSQRPKTSGLDVIYWVTICLNFRQVKIKTQTEVS